VKIQVNSDKNIAVDTQLIQFVEGEVNRAMGRFKEKLTRVEVHLSDTNSNKFGKQDKRCLIEARPARHRPVAVTTGAPTVESAVRGSLSKLRNSLETFFGRMNTAQLRARGVKSRSAGKTVTKGSDVKTTKGTAVQKKTSKVGGKKSTAKSSSKKVAAKPVPTTEATSGRGVKKKAIYQARRKSWPSR